MHFAKKVVAQCVFYAVFLTVVGSIVVILHLFDNIAFGTLLSEIKSLPILISSGAWWLVTTYVLIVLIAPMLNRLIENINNRGAIVLAIYFGLLYGVVGIGTVYYNILRAPLYYLIGALIKSRNITIKRNSHRCLIIIIFVFTWITYSTMRYLQIVHLNDETTLWKAYESSADYFMSGLLIPVISVSLFLFLSSLNFSNSVVNKIASTTFGVYLIHGSNIGRELIWNNIIRPEYTQFSLVWYKYVFSSLVTVLIIFTICALIDIFRQLVFEKWMEKKIDWFVSYFKQKCYYKA